MTIEMEKHIQSFLLETGLFFKKLPNRDEIDCFEFDSCDFAEFEEEFLRIHGVRCCGDMIEQAAHNLLDCYCLMEYTSAFWKAYASECLREQLSPIPLPCQSWFESLDLRWFKSVEIANATGIQDAWNKVNECRG